jgi:hypothetical protein
MNGVPNRYGMSMWPQIGWKNGIIQVLARHEWRSRVQALKNGEIDPFAIPRFAPTTDLAQDRLVAAHPRPEDY